MGPRIFIIGFNKTATRSLHGFFKKNKLPSVHWDNHRLAKTFERNKVLGNKLLTDGTTRYGREYEKITVFSDITNAATLQESMHYYKDLDRDYPGSKFILNIRDTDSWINSRFNHARGALYRQHLKYLALPDNHAGRDTLRQVYRTMHENHHKDVINHFKNRENDLVIYNIHEDKIIKIVKFLEDHYTLNPKHWSHDGRTKKRDRRFS